MLKHESFLIVTNGFVPFLLIQYLLSMNLVTALNLSYLCILLIIVLTFCEKLFM